MERGYWGYWAPCPMRAGAHLIQVSGLGCVLRLDALEGVVWRRELWDAMPDEGPGTPDPGGWGLWDGLLSAS